MNRRTLLCSIPAMLAARLASAETDLASPIGLWQTVDDKTGEARGVVRLFEENGTLFGRIGQVLDPKAVGKTCEACRDDRKNQPILGLSVIRGLKPDGPGRWAGGEILDPETGDTYRVSIQLTDGGQHLVVRGSILGGLIGRSQTWRRVATSPDPVKR